MDFKQYTTYLRFAWDEELERMAEWLAARQDPNTIWNEGGDKYWIGLSADEIGLPTLNDMHAMMASRDFDADLHIMEHGSEEHKERLYETLRS